MYSTKKIYIYIIYIYVYIYNHIDKIISRLPRHLAITPEKIARSTWRYFSKSLSFHIIPADFKNTKFRPAFVDSCMQICSCLCFDSWAGTAQASHHGHQQGVEESLPGPRFGRAALVDVNDQKWIQLQRRAKTCCWTIHGKQRYNTKWKISKISHKTKRWNIF